MAVMYLLARYVPFFFSPRRGWLVLGLVWLGLIKHGVLGLSGLRHFLLLFAAAAGVVVGEGCSEVVDAVGSYRTYCSMECKWIPTTTTEWVLHCTYMAWPQSMISDQPVSVFWHCLAF